MPKMTISRINKMIIMAIRLIVGIGLGYFLIHLTLKYTGTDLLGEAFDANKPILIFACLFDGALISLTICRWNLLLRVQGIYLKIWDLIRLTMIGNFFSLALPGAAGDQFRGLWKKETTGLRCFGIAAVSQRIGSL